MSEPTNADITLAFLKEKIGMKFSMRTLVDNLGIKVLEMRAAVEVILPSIHICNEGKITRYYVATPEQIKALQPPPVQKVRIFKPYKPDKSLMDALDRCAELYPVGRGFISIS